MALFEIKNLCFSYPGTGEIIKNISMDIEKGDFITLCGPTGCGKTTLLRLLKPELTPTGIKTGVINYKGEQLNEQSGKSIEIGFVQQSVDHQIVTDKVWHEVAFGMENAGFSDSLMKRRAAEVMGWFSVDSLFDCKTEELSGGQKQIVSLASVMALNPQVIILDEPTSQLDPVAAASFLTSLKQLNEELGVTVIITEHRLENVIPLSNKLCLIDKGEIIRYGNVKDTVKELLSDDKYVRYMPGSAKLYKLLGMAGECPLNVCEGKKYLNANPLPQKGSYTPEYNEDKTEPAVELKNVCFRYDRNSQDVLKETDLTVYKGEILCMLGSNGSGKTTLLRAVSGLVKPYYGKVEINGKNINKYKGQELYNNCLTMLPQNVETVFLYNSLKEELEKSGISFDVIPYDLSYAANTHPYDLSGGEQQLAAIAKALSTNPRILLLDEPTKGLDYNSKQIIAKVLKSLKAKGTTILIVTHDIEFSAMCADRVAMLFRGAVTCCDHPHKFFSDNAFYTTSISKITRDFCDNLITDEDVEKYLEGAQ